MAINDGGPAFPSSVAEIHGRATNSDEFGLRGMSLRDYFAGQALAGICGDGIPGRHHMATDTAMMAYEYADAMIAQREKE
jgi:hypothetical protein